MAIQDDVKANVMALLNADDITVDGTVEIFGMVLRESVIEYGISLGYTYINELIGSSDIADLTKKNKIVACLTDMTMLRVWGTLAGVSIPTHYNYKIGDNTISKNVHPMIEMNLKIYTDSVKMWKKFLLSGSWSAVSPQDDLTFVSPIYSEEYGHDYVDIDSSNI